jgi:hypothetical protein
MGKESQYPSGQDETQAHNLSSRQKENRGRSARAVGEAEGAAEEACVAASSAVPKARNETCDSTLRRWLYHPGFDNELVGRFPDRTDLARRFAGRTLFSA